LIRAFNKYKKKRAPEIIIIRKRVLAIENSLGSTIQKKEEYWIILLIANHKPAI